MLRVVSRTVTVVTHVQPEYDPNGISVAGCRRIIESGRAGEVFEHRVAGEAYFELVPDRPYVTDASHVLRQPPNGYHLPSTAIRGLERVIAVGGSFLLPDGYYPGHRRDRIGMCHFDAFGVLAIDLNGASDERPVEIHLPSDGLYSTAHGMPAREDLYRHPLPSEHVLDAYSSWLRATGIAHALYLNETLQETIGSSPRLSLHFWRTSADLVAALPS